MAREREMAEVLRRQLLEQKRLMSEMAARLEESQEEARILVSEGGEARRICVELETMWTG